MARDVEEYIAAGMIRREANLKKVSKLHNLVFELKEKFLEDPTLQNLLLERGDELEESKRPKSFHDVHDCFNSMKVSVHLSFLDYVLDILSKPRIISMERPSIIIPGEEVERNFETPEGFNAIAIEELQAQWLTNAKVASTVQEYKKALEQSFGEYNLKFILNMIEKCRYHFIPNDTSWKNEKKIQEKIVDASDNSSYSALDSAYYTMGNRLLKSASKYWNELSKSELGRKFILDIDAETKSIQESFEPRK